MRPVQLLEHWLVVLAQVPELVLLVELPCSKKHGIGSGTSRLKRMIKLGGDNRFSLLVFLIKLQAVRNLYTSGCKHIMDRAIFLYSQLRSFMHFCFVKLSP